MPRPRLLLMKKRKENLQYQNQENISSPSGASEDPPGPSVTPPSPSVTPHSLVRSGPGGEPPKSNIDLTLHIKLPNLKPNVFRSLQ